jgi:transcriptional regulator with XRE-family HTH domain
VPRGGIGVTHVRGGRAVTDSQRVQALRKALGHELAARRRGVGLTQAGFARRAGYSRSSVSTIECGTQAAAAAFWAACDRVLQTGDLFTSGHDRIQAQQVADSRAANEAARAAAATRIGTAWPQGYALGAADPAEALAAYRDLGWQVEHVEGRMELVTCADVEALEVRRPAGVLAAGWWTESKGAPDIVRGLPALPHPAESMAVIAAGPRCWFLVRGGDCPWVQGDTRGGEPGDGAVIRWHAYGSRIPAPPSPAEDGHPAAWARVPCPPMRLPSAVALLDLLAKAAAAAGDQHALTLPGGVRAVPASAPARAGPTPQ